MLSKLIHNFYKKERNECCFICYEIIYKNEIKPIKLNSNNLYFKNCKCDGHIHKICLSIWYNKSRECPICRKPMREKTNIVVNNFYKKKIIIFISFLQKNYYFIITFISLLHLIYRLYKFLSTKSLLYHFQKNN